MTAYQHYELHCDAPGCDAVYNVADKRADATRARAAKEGWVHGVEPPAPHRGGPARSLDYCPAHAGRIGELAPKTLPRHARPVP